MTATMAALNVKPTPETLTRQKWALALAAKGFKILELEPGAKVPRAGVAWSVSATSDPNKIKAMFKASPAMNCGVCPGENHVILDLDKKIDVDGVEAFEKLELENALLPETFKVRTRSGGLHVYLKVSEEVGNAHKFGKGCGIDIRGGHGYVVGPGCYVASGKHEWGDGVYSHEGGDLDSIADCPEWVRGLLGRSSRKNPQRIAPLCELDLKHNIKEAERFLARRDPAIAGENGNDWTWETVAFVRDIGLSDSMALEVIHESEWNLKRCDPPWTADELATLIENVYRYAENRPGSKRAPLSKVRL